MARTSKDGPIFSAWSIRENAAAILQSMFLSFPLLFHHSCIPQKIRKRLGLGGTCRYKSHLYHT